MGDAKVASQGSGLSQGWLWDTMTNLPLHESRGEGQRSQDKPPPQAQGLPSRAVLRENKVELPQAVSSWVQHGVAIMVSEHMKRWC